MDIDKYIKIFMYIFKHQNPLIFEKYKKKNMISLFIIHYIQRATNAFFFFFLLIISIFENQIIPIIILTLC